MRAVRSVDAVPVFLDRDIVVGRRHTHRQGLVWEVWGVWEQCSAVRCGAMRLQRTPSRAKARGMGGLSEEIEMQPLHRQCALTHPPPPLRPFVREP